MLPKTLFDDADFLERVKKQPKLVDPRKISGLGCPPGWHIFPYQFQGYVSSVSSPELYSLECRKEEVIDWFLTVPEGRLTFWTFCTHVSGISLCFELQKDAFNWIMFTGFSADNMIISKPSEKWDKTFRTFWE